MKSLIAAAIVAAVALPAAANAGDRYHGHHHLSKHASAQEWREVVRKLHRNGFYKWDEIELERRGTVWEIDDAVHRSGQRFDLWLARGSLRLIKKDRE